MTKETVPCSSGFVIPKLKQNMWICNLLLIADKQ